MEKDQEFKHLCKFCNKSFPSGRSLGGHIKSHLNNSSEFVQKVNKKKLPFLGINGDKKLNNEACDQSSYKLRENPKNKNKFSKPSEDSLLDSKLCKECGKVFQSWKALFGHMKCHSERLLSNSVEDSQSDNEAVAPNRRKRSRRIVKRYMVSNTTSDLTIANATSRCVSDNEQEREEIAMSLILLSMDVGNLSGVNSIGESSGNNSEFLEAPLLRKMKNGTKNGLKMKILEDQTDETLKKIELDNGNGFEGSGVEFPRNLIKESGENQIGFDSKTTKKKKNSRNRKSFDQNDFELKSNAKLEATILDSKNGLKVKTSEFQTDENLNKIEIENGNGFEGSGVGLSKNLITESGKNQTEVDSKTTIKKRNSRKRKSPDQNDLVLNSKFVCTMCNKKFHSYQALGGHRASHKRLNGCSASKINSSENSTETELELIPNQTADSFTNMVEKFIENFDGSKKRKGHECSICFKIFSSGQALGGHKRSHVIAEAKNNQSVVVIEKSIPEVRDFLDLNLPPPVEEESCDQVGFKPWWIQSNQKHKELMSLFSN